MILYSIKWRQEYKNWEPFELPITNFKEALEVIQKAKQK